MFTCNMCSIDCNCVSNNPYKNNIYMKANEAPEKIYLLHDDRYVDDLSIIWFEAPYATGSIEYTRTDAFIEKSKEFLYKKLNSGEMECGDIAVFIEKFINYMKGE